MKIQKYKRGQIWWYNLNAVFDGSTYNQGKNRPVIIVSNELANANSNTLIAVPCTSQDKKEMPTHVIFDNNGIKNTAMAECLMSVSTDKLGAYIGTLDDELIEKLEGCILVALGMRNVIAENAVKRAIVNNTSEQTNPRLFIENGVITPTVDYPKKDLALTLKMIGDANKIKDNNNTSNFSATIPIFDDSSSLEEKLSTRKAYDGVGKKGHKKYTREQMSRFINDCENHTIEWVTKKYNCSSEKATSNKLYRFRKFLKENP